MKNTRREVSKWRIKHCCKHFVFLERTVLLNKHVPLGKGAIDPSLHRFTASFTNAYSKPWIQSSLQTLLNISVAPY